MIVCQKTISQLPLLSKVDVVAKNGQKHDPKIPSVHTGTLWPIVAWQIEFWLFIAAPNKALKT